MNDYKEVNFSRLKIGDEFECRGDQHLDYEYVKFCDCVKTEDNEAEEINGDVFFMNDDDKVFIKSTSNG